MMASRSGAVSASPPAIETVRRSGGLAAEPEARGPHPASIGERVRQQHGAQAAGASRGRGACCADHRRADQEPDAPAGGRQHRLRSQVPDGEAGQRPQCAAD
jgi:hypothetical protein